MSARNEQLLKLVHDLRSDFAAISAYAQCLEHDASRHRQDRIAQFALGIQEAVLSMDDRLKTFSKETVNDEPRSC